MGHEHLLIFSPSDCHLFFRSFSLLTMTSCSLLFLQRKHLVSLCYLSSPSFLRPLKLLTSVSAPFLAALACINLSWLHIILICYAIGVGIQSGSDVGVSHSWAFLSYEQKHMLYRIFSQILNESKCCLIMVYHLPCDSYSFLIPWNANLTSAPTSGNGMGTRYAYLWWC